MPVGLLGKHYNDLENKAKIKFTSWGTELKFTVSFSIFKISVCSASYTVWIAGTNDIYVEKYSNTHSSANGTVTIDNITFERNGNNITITSKSTGSIMAIYY